MDERRDEKTFTLPTVKPCHVVLNDIRGLLNEEGIYMVPGRSRRNLTCYRCFKKFDSAEFLEIHKAEHDPESEEENVYAVSDSGSEIEIESESEEEVVDVVLSSAVPKQTAKPSTNTVVEKQIPTDNARDAVIEYVPRPPESPKKIVVVETPKQIQVVEPLRTPGVQKVVPLLQERVAPKENEKTTKTPVLCNIQIKCLTCDIMFTNSALLMEHKPIDKEKPCCFTCKVCTESYSQPSDYLNHIMQHNVFSSSRSSYNRRKPEFKCNWCNEDFEHKIILMQHEGKCRKKSISPPVLEMHVHEPTKLQPNLTPTPVQKPGEPVKKPEELVKKPEEPAKKPEEPVKKQEDPDLTPIEIEVNIPEPEPASKKPKIWVIKEAMMKSPEPTTSAAKVPTNNAVKRKLDDLTLKNDSIRPTKRGRPNKETPRPSVSKTGGVEVETVISLTCDVCYDVFQNKKDFDEHMVYHNKKNDHVKTVNVVEGHICNLCNANFKSAAGLKRHITCAHELKKVTSFVCAACSKIFSSRKGLNIHKNTCVVDADKRVD